MQLGLSILRINPLTPRILCRISTPLTIFLSPASDVVPEIPSISHASVSPKLHSHQDHPAQTANLPLPPLRCYSLPQDLVTPSSKMPLSAPVPWSIPSSKMSLYPSTWSPVSQLAYLSANLQIPLKVKVSVTHSCLTLCNPMNHSPPGSSVCGILQARILEWEGSPLQGIFPTQGSNRGTSQCRQILYI